MEKKDEKVSGRKCPTIEKAHLSCHRDTEEEIPGVEAVPWESVLEDRATEAASEFSSA